MKELEYAWNSIDHPLKPKNIGRILRGNWTEDSNSHQFVDQWFVYICVLPDDLYACMASFWIFAIFLVLLKIMKERNMQEIWVVFWNQGVPIRILSGSGQKMFYQFVDLLFIFILIYLMTLAFIVSCWIFIILLVLLKVIEERDMRITGIESWNRRMLIGY